MAARKDGKTGKRLAKTGRFLTPSKTVSVTARRPSDMTGGERILKVGPGLADMKFERATINVVSVSHGAVPTEDPQAAEDREDAEALARAIAERDPADYLDAATVNAILDGTLHPLRAVRKAHGMTLEALAIASGASVSMVSEVETFKKTGTVPFYVKAARALGCLVDDIVPNVD